MTTTHSSPTDQLDAYNRRLAEECPFSVTTWKAAKGILYTLFVLAIVWWTGTRTAATWQLGAIGVAAIVVFYVGEAREIELAGLLTVIFQRNGGGGG